MEGVVASALAVDVGADFDAGDSLLHGASNSTAAVKGAKHRPVTWVILAWCDHLHRRCPSRRDRCRTVRSSLGPGTHTTPASPRRWSRRATAPRGGRASPGAPSFDLQAG